MHSLYKKVQQLGNISLNREIKLTYLGNVSMNPMDSILLLNFSGLGAAE